MSYTIRKFNGTELVVLQDGTIDTSISVALVGRNYTGYGELQNQNFLYLLENFANAAPPSTPLVGQTWFSTENNNLHVYDGSGWSLVGTATVSDTAPENPPSGSLWFDSDENKLYCWIGAWVFVGPENVPGYGKTKAESMTLLSDTGSRYPVILMYVNDAIQAIVSSSSFTISSTERPEGFLDLIVGMNYPDRSTAANIKGNLEGTASKAAILDTTRLINGVGFNGSRDITITAASPFSLTSGDYIVGGNFNGSSQITWSVDATSNNTIGTVVARDSAGDFSAGTITADLIGNVQGNITAVTGTSTFNIVTANQFVGASLSGNANTATRLRTPRNINGVSFDGTQDVTIPVSGENVTGTRLANNVVNSNLSTLGTLTELRINDAGLSIGNILNLSLESGVSKIEIDNNQGFNISIQDSSVAGGYSSIELIAAGKNLSQGGESTSSIIPKNNVNIGDTYSPFNKIHANSFIGNLQGNSSTATLATTSTNLAGGAAGSVPYQTASGTTSFVPPGSSGQVLRSSGAGEPTWGSISFSTLTRGTYLTGANYDGIVNTTWAVDATSSNTANKVVARDSSGNFSAGIITATLNGNITGNAATVTELNFNQIINGLGYTPASTNILTEGNAATLNTIVTSGDITLDKSNPTIFFNHRGDSGVELAISVQGENLIFYEPEDGNREWFRINDSEQKAYIFGESINTTDTLRVTYGNTQLSTSGYTNQVGSFNDSRNHFDVFPPSGYSMSNLIGFMPSIALIHYAGGVDSNDSLRCTWTNLGDRIRVYVQNTEQRSTPAANWLAIWRR